MGLHLCYDLAGRADVDVRVVVAELRRFARDLPFERVGPVLCAPTEPALSGAGWHLPVDHEGLVREREWAPPQGTPSRWITVPPVDWVGFRVRPGRGCETATFGLARHPPTVECNGRDVETYLDHTWRWHGVCKTQHASSVSWDHFMTLHGSLVSVLDHAGSLGILGEVRDETGFWDSRDWKQSVDETERMNVVVRRIGGALERALGDTQDQGDGDRPQ